MTIIVARNVEYVNKSRAIERQSFGKKKSLEAKVAWVPILCLN